MKKCGLCKGKDRLSGSHIIPKFVFDGIKSNSPTGYLRCASQPNVRRQDGDKTPLLCANCERRFGEAERKFAKHVFRPFQEGCVLPLTYGPWLNYFISSVNWRTLHLDNPEFHTSAKLSGKDLTHFYNAENVLTDYLLGNRNDIGNIENHIFFWENMATDDVQLISARPNTMIRSSAFSYSFVDFGHNAYYVYANLAGIIICTVIRKKADEKWVNTSIQLDGGKIAKPQYISSPLMYEIGETITEMSKATMSEKQSRKLINSLRANPIAVQESKAFRFHEQDRRLKGNEGTDGGTNSKNRRIQF
ncbi:MAG: hypothetical protein ABIH42_04390 [Planctomycetota bacterium]